ncbi:hypothetical protein IAD21_03423 [Abditibacteriota bacterium]|nr:hypothetical protein IAD21_03423 [Abditibacteriota bacterium]
MKRAFTLIEVLIVVVVIALIAAFLWPIFARPDRGGRRSSCQSNLKQIGLGFLQYVQDYDERLPPARVTSATGWSDVITTYTKSTQLFQCPSGPSTTTSFSSDYFYNRRLARVTMDKINVAGLTVMAGEGEDNAPTWNSWAGMPADADTNTDSPVQRHKGFANYLFTDGHVKALIPTRVSSTFAAPTSRPTFAFR